METERGTTQEFNRFPFVRDLHEIQPVFPEADFGLGITSGLPVIRPELVAIVTGTYTFPEPVTHYVAEWSARKAVSQ